jgi:hypothetical protein
VSRRRATALAALAAAALAGCGSRDVADYPPPASVPRGDFPPIADLPGRVVPRRASPGPTTGSRSTGAARR